MNNLFPAIKQKNLVKINMYLAREMKINHFIL